jgi:hypothetical protein
MSPDEGPQNSASERREQTRRSFLGGAGRKALYVTPTVLTLAAQRAFGSAPICGSNFKHTVGSPCSLDGVAAKKCCDHDTSGTGLVCFQFMDGHMECQPFGFSE